MPTDCISCVLYGSQKKNGDFLYKDLNHLPYNGEEVFTVRYGLNL
jgi:hypothetical protein